MASSGMDAGGDSLAREWRDAEKCLISVPQAVIFLISTDGSIMYDNA